MSGEKTFSSTEYPRATAYQDGRLLVSTLTDLKAYRLDAQGNLTLEATGAYVAQSIAVVPGTDDLYIAVGDIVRLTITGGAFQETGRLKMGSNDTPEAVHTVAYNPTKSVVYAVVSGRGYQSLLTASRGLQFIAQTPADLPEVIGVHPSGGFVYTASAVNGGTITMFTTGSDGRLVPTGRVFPSSGTAVDMDLTPDGRFLYTANFDSNSVGGYSVGGDGILSPLPGSPYAAGARPNSVTVTSNGQFLYAANGGAAVLPSSPERFPGSDDISGYRIQSNGSLTPTPGSPYKVNGSGPRGIVSGTR